MNYEINRPTAAGAFTFNLLPTGQPGVTASGNGVATALLGFVSGFAAREPSYWTAIAGISPGLRKTIGTSPAISR